MTPTENWPKPWLLQIHQQAVEHGMIWIEPITKADAESLRQRLYRVRRRSDKSTASFILPEYHMVTVGAWEDRDGGRLPVIYSRRPDGQALPNITPVSAEDQTEYLQQPTRTDIIPSPEQIMNSIDQMPSEDLVLKPDEINDFVGTMLKKVNKS